MCGIAGVISKNASIKTELLSKLVKSLKPRGPDADNVWLSPDGMGVLIHTRLAILDLSEQGAQPMVSDNYQIAVTFNGEIYNFLDLKSELLAKNYSFRGHSDTEVLLKAVHEWGVRKTAEKLRGMFAFCVWDLKNKTIYLVRDGFGIKPLYYYYDGNELAFSSQLKPIIQYYPKLNTISKTALSRYLRYGYIPQNDSIFEHIKKLEPGSILTFPLTGHAPSIEYFYSIKEAAIESKNNAFKGTASEAISELSLLLTDSLKKHMLSDVPVGAFLSGGIDSSLIASIASKLSGSSLKTFTIGFKEYSFNESDYALKVAKHLGTEHSELYLSSSEALSIAVEMPKIYDEPFADVSQMPTFLVSRLAKDSVKVVLSGDGGDELFGGYNRYLFVSSFWGRLNKYPDFLRRFASASLSSLNPNLVNLFSEHLNSKISNKIPLMLGNKLLKASAIFKSKSLFELHQILCSQWNFPSLMLDQHYPDPSLLRDPFFPQLLEYPLQQMCWDTESYLIDDILMKVDKASMAVGLEARVPLIDKEVFKFAWSLPLEMKICNGKGKWILRELLSHHLPRHLIDRPKQGFGVPIDDWLRGPFRDLANTYLAPGRLISSGYLNEKLVCQLWNTHLKGKSNYGGILWAIIMFEMWLEESAKWN